MSRVRDNASCIRPRLYDADDPVRPDDVSLVLDALEEKLQMEMAKGNTEKVEHASDLKRRIDKAAGAEDDGGGG